MKMYDMPRIDVKQSTTTYDNVPKYTNIYEMLCNVNVRHKKTHHYDIDVAHKSFTYVKLFLMPALPTKSLK